MRPLTIAAITVATSAAVTDTEPPPGGGKRSPGLTDDRGLAAPSLAPAPPGSRSCRG
jgi:hypothetical protein